MWGIFIAISAYFIWALFPIYWKIFSSIPPFELICHRLLWTFIACSILIPLRGQWPQFKKALSSRREMTWSAAAAIALSINWYSFVWAVNNGRVAESSLGYFLCPLTSLCFAVFLEKEKLRPLQWTGFSFAAIAVGILFFDAQEFPIAALSIAISWASYGYIKKKTPLGPISSLGMETMLLVPVSIIAILLIAGPSENAFSVAPLEMKLGLITTGVITAIPLLLFATASKIIPINTLGLFQYIVPIGHFLLAYILYNEPVSILRLSAFALIGFGCATYIIDQFRHHTFKFRTVSQSV